MLRKGHLFPGESDSNILSRSDVRFTPYGLIVKVKKSKTIQFKQREVDIPVCFGGGIFCVVDLLRAYFNTIFKHLFCKTCKPQTWSTLEISYR